MTIGPLEYLVIEFEGNHFTGEILPELKRLRDTGTVRLVDLVFIQKDAQGNLTERELSDLSSEEAVPFGSVAGDMLRLLSPEDIDDIAETVAPNSSVAVALLEHLWAIHLKETIANAQGVVLSEGLVPMAQVEAMDAELAAQHATVQG